MFLHPSVRRAVRAVHENPEMAVTAGAVVVTAGAIYHHQSRQTWLTKVANWLRDNTALVDTVAAGISKLWPSAGILVSTVVDAFISLCSGESLEEFLLRVVRVGRSMMLT